MKVINPFIQNLIHMFAFVQLTQLLHKFCACLHYTSNIFVLNFSIFQKIQKNIKKIQNHYFQNNEEGLLSGESHMNLQQFVSCQLHHGGLDY